MGCGGDDGDKVVTQTIQLIDLTNGSLVSDGSATLTRIGGDEPGVLIQLDGPGVQGHIYTYWWGFFNNPGDCTTDPNHEMGETSCGMPDFGGDQANLTLATLAYGGHVIGDSDGRIFAEYFEPVGAVPRACKPSNSGCAIPDLDHGFDDAFTAEVHFAIQDHLLPSDDPDVAALQREAHGAFGGCVDIEDPECTDYLGGAFPPAN